MTEFATSKKYFQQADRHCFEWLYALEEYRGDILDSFLQTLKHLQYEFFAASAHAFFGALPAQQDFRSMEEMAPDRLQKRAQLHALLQEEPRVACQDPEPG